MTSLSEALHSFSAVVVTGGSSGIGKSFIELCVKLNPHLLVCNLSRRIPEINLTMLKLCHVPCDLADATRVTQAIDEVVDILQRKAPTGRILLINNSGFGSYGRFPTPGIGHQLEMIDVNVRAVLQLTEGLLPHMKKRGGAIVNIASTAAFQPLAYMTTYAATKAFLLHWSLGLHEELRGSGVTSLAVCPGPTSTAFGKRAGVKDGGVPDSFGQTSEQVVIEALKALAAGKSQVVTGWKNKTTAFFASKLPKPLAARIGAKVIERFRLSKVADE